MPANVPQVHGRGLMAPPGAGLPPSPGVARLIINSNKAPGPVAQVVRDAVLPVVLRLTANSKQANQQCRYHIDWNTPISSTTG
jgi:hypothetical protein